MSGSKGQAWFCTTGQPRDVVIEVEGMTFHLHKLPLISKSRKIHELITEQDENGARRMCADVEEENNEMEGNPYRISLHDFPGGSEIFEMAAKFCYGVKISLTSVNVAALRCAAEYLDMTEEFSEENLIAKTERFLFRSVFRNLTESLKTLKSCETLMPLAEVLDIVQRCIDAIASGASSSDPSLFGWPINDGSSDQGDMSQILCRRKENWFEELTVLRLPIFKRVISAMSEQEVNSEIIENSLITYAKRSIPGLSRSNRKKSPVSIASESEQRDLLETVVQILSNYTSSSVSSKKAKAATRFLFRLLRTANILNASESCRSLLERKIAMQLDRATLDDLLLPSFSYLIETLYDVDCVERILGYFLEGLDERVAPVVVCNGSDGEVANNIRSPASNPIVLVAKLLDAYLAEIASDANLKPEKFYNLAVTLPDHARVFDDGLYEAIDVYLKAHPWISEEERDKICGTMDCQKLTLEACTHAAQNERLPLRTVVQVLFFEQLHLRQAITGSILSGPPEFQEPWRSTMQSGHGLGLDMDSMRNRVHELERECLTMKRAIRRMDRSAPTGPTSSSNPITGTDTGTGGWSSLTKKFGCKFNIQVCDSQGTVVEARRVRPPPPPPSTNL